MMLSPHPTEPLRGFQRPGFGCLHLSPLRRSLRTGRIPGVVAAPIDSNWGQVDIGLCQWTGYSTAVPCSLDAGEVSRAMGEWCSCDGVYVNE